VFDYQQMDLSQVDRALCDIAVKLTLTPGQMERKDVDHLRDLGLSDHAITIAVQVIAYFNYINRVADGLGVDDETWMTLPKEEWVQRKRQWPAHQLSTLDS